MEKSHNIVRPKISKIINEKNLEKMIFMKKYILNPKMYTCESKLGSRFWGLKKFIYDANIP